MPIHTPNGLKIRLSEEVLNSVLEPILDPVIGGISEHSEFLSKVEDWMDFPQSLAGLGCIVGALYSSNWLVALLAGIVTYLLGDVMVQVSHSKYLRILVVNFLGKSLLAFVVPLLSVGFLVWKGNLATAMAAIVFLIANHFGITSALLVIGMPIRLFLTRLLKLEMTASERAFIALCNERARERGVEIRWSGYTKLFSAS